MSKILYILFAIAVIAYLYFGFLRTPGAKAGEKAPDFTAQLIDGTSFTLSELQGNYVLLDFWASWCGPCRVDNPKIVQLHEQFDSKEFKDAKGFEIVTVALEKNDRSWEKAAKSVGFTWKYQIVELSKFVMLSKIAKQYNVSNVPSKFLINPKGEIIGTNQSYDELEKFLRLRLVL